MTDDTAAAMSPLKAFLDANRVDYGPVRCNDFRPRFSQALQGRIGPDDFGALLTFVSNQCGYWAANWYFSDAALPDFVAKEESDGWRQLWNELVVVISTHLPRSLDRVEKEHNHTILMEFMKRRRAFNETHMPEKIAASVYSALATGLDRIGFRNWATRLMIKAQYPKGTVGRL
jgi:hypothetical protein